MSFETSIGKYAALKVTDLYLKVDSLDKKIPLDHVNISMQVNGACTCTCVPCIGRDKLNGKTVNPNFIDLITPSSVCSIYLKVKKGNESCKNDGLIFRGRMLGSDLTVNNHPLGSSAGIKIVLRHIAEADLMGVSIAQRSYYRNGAEWEPFRIDMSKTSYSEDSAFLTDSLEQKKIAVYLKELCEALVKWYMNGDSEVKVNSILKAVPCVVKKSISDILIKSTGENMPGSVQEAFVRAVKTAFQGALSSKATLMAILSSLASFGMLSLVPTRKSLVIAPTLAVSRWTLKTGFFLPRMWISGIYNPYTPGRFPIERVALNRSFSCFYDKADIRDISISGLFSYGQRYTYPEDIEGSVMLVDPPPILSGVVNCCNVLGEMENPPKPLDAGGNDKTDINSAGGKPVEVKKDDYPELVKSATKLMWSSIAFSHHSATLSVIPHWIFNESYSEDVHEDYDPSSMWSALNKNVFFKMPYSSEGYGDTANDVAYVGYVKGMTLDVSVATANVAVNMNVTNVRTALDDQKFALPEESNPLYDDTTAEPV